MTFALDNGSFQDANWQTGELEYNDMLPANASRRWQPIPVW